MLKDTLAAETKREEAMEAAANDSIVSRPSLQPSRTAEDRALDQLADTMILDHEKHEQHKASVEQKLMQEIQHHRAQAALNEVVPARLSAGAAFDWFIAVAVFANAIHMAVSLDYEEELGISYITAIENIFCVIWVLEVIVNVARFGARGYFSWTWYRFDFFLALVSMVDCWIIPLAQSGTASGGSFGWALFRLPRLLRMIRLVKLLKAFKELWILANGLIRAMSVLGWMCLLMGFVIFCTALVFTSWVGVECGSEGSFENWAECYTMFGTVPRSMFTLFQTSTLESWAMAIARPVLEEKPYIVVLFVVYLFFTTFGLFNIMVGAIVEQTMQATQETNRKFEDEKMMRQLKDVADLKNIFHLADADRSGMVTIEEFLITCTREDVQDMFSMLDLNVKRPNLARRLFEVLDLRQSGEMNISELLERTWSLMTEGRALKEDMSLLLLETRHLSRKMTALGKDLGMDLETKSERAKLTQGDDTAVLPPPLAAIGANKFSGIASTLLHRFSAMEKELGARMCVLEDKVALAVDGSIHPASV